MEAFILWAAFESTFSKKEASTSGTDGHFTFWQTICVIFCRKVHPLAVLVPVSSSMAAVSKTFTFVVCIQRALKLMNVGMGC